MLRSILPIFRGIAVLLIDAANYGMHPLSPYAAKAILLRNRIERPL